MVIFIDEKLAFAQMSQKKIERQAGMISFPEMKVGKEGGLATMMTRPFPSSKTTIKFPKASRLWTIASGFSESMPGWGLLMMVRCPLM